MGGPGHARCFYDDSGIKTQLSRVPTTSQLSHWICKKSQKSLWSYWGSGNLNSCLEGPGRSRCSGDDSSVKPQLSRVPTTSESPHQMSENLTGHSGHGYVGTRQPRGQLFSVSVS